MNIAGIQHFSLLDYPGKMSAIIFTQGCLLRCTYCHNQTLQTISSGSISLDEVLNFLTTRVGLLEGVVFSGGEPLLQRDLYDAMVQVKNLGFNIGLHTSGAVPSQFEKVLPVVNWVGFDIKTTFNNYEQITKIPNSGELAQSSFMKLLNFRDSVNFEVRTTVDSRYIKFEDLEKIAEFLKKNNIHEWILQQCILRYSDRDDVTLQLPSNDELKRLQKIIKVKVRF